MDQTWFMQYWNRTNKEWNEDPVQIINPFGNNLAYSAGASITTLPGFLFNGISVGYNAARSELQNQQQIATNNIERVAASVGWHMTWGMEATSHWALIYSEMAVFRFAPSKFQVPPNPSGEGNAATNSNPSLSDILKVGDKTPGNAADKADAMRPLLDKKANLQADWSYVEHTGSDGTKLFHGRFGEAIIIKPDGSIFISRVSTNLEDVLRFQSGKFDFSFFKNLSPVKRE